MKALKQLTQGVIPALFLTFFASPGQAGYADDVLELGPSLYYRLDETDIKPSGLESGSVVRNHATNGLLFNASFATQGGSITQSTGQDQGAVAANAGIHVTGWSVHGEGVTAAGTTPFTLNFWVKPERIEEGNSPCLFHAGNHIAGGPVVEPKPVVHGYAPHIQVGGENNLLIGLEGNAGGPAKVVLGTYGIRYCVSQGGLEPGRWNSIGLSYDGTRLRLYLNGQPDVVFDVSGRNFSSGNGRYFLLGNEYVTGKHPFTGGLDEFAYWNGTVLSDARMRRLGTAAAPVPAASGPLAAPPQSVMDLNGSWQFRMDPKNEGEAGAWFGAEASYPDTIQVPGNWQTQGFGEPSGITRHNYQGRAWHRRSFSIPEDWKNHRVVLRLEGVMNYGDVWLNGRKLGRVRTFITPYEFDVTGDLKVGAENTLAVMADSQHPPELSYIGMMQFLNRFGGIHSHVKLIALADPMIREVAFTPDFANNTVHVGLDLERRENAAAWQGGVRVEIRPADGGKSQDLRGEASFAAGARAVKVKGLNVAIPDLRLWSPEDPFLYDVKIGLYDGDRLLTEKSVRTGFREIKVDADGDILLNSRKYYILGCGYDSLEPVYGTPPPDKEVYKERLQHLKDLGFNAVRFLSHTPIKEFFDAADEVGMLVQAEGEWFMAYSPMPPAVGALFSDQVPRIIREHGNHPSWYAFSCFNEAYDLNTDPVKRAYVNAAYQSMRGLRPDLLFMPSDGVGDAWPTDVITGPSEIRHAIKLLDGTGQPADTTPKQVFTGGIQPPLHTAEDYRKPFLWHEYNNTYIAPLPDLDVEKKLTGAMTQTAVLEHHHQRIEGYGLLPRYPELRQQSFKLYREYVKQAFEELRHMPHVDGFAWWVVSDIPAGVETDVSSLAVLDMVYKPEKFTDTAWFRQFNSQSVLLIDADIDARVLRSSEAKPVRISLSHFGAPPVKNGRLEWKLTADGKNLQQGTVTDIDAATGSVTEIASLELGPLDITAAAPVRLEATFTSESGVQSNSWKFWAFPDLKPGLPRANILNLTGNPALDARYGASTTMPLGDAGLVLATTPTEELLSHIDQGGKVIFLESDAGRAAPLLQAVKPRESPPLPEHSSFLRKPGAVSYWASWIRCNAQLIEEHPMLAAFPHEGFTDFQLARLFGHSVPTVNYTSKDSVARGKVRPIIWNLNLSPWTEDPTPWGFALTWNSLLSEARMGNGRMVLCNLWVLDGVKRGLPEAGYLLDCLVDYALSDKFASGDLPALTDEEARKLFLIEDLPVR